MRKAAIIQPSFIPWKGYFDIINEVDVFVFLDDVQYTKKDWRNRNRIKTPGGVKWITVPVTGGVHQHICDTAIDYARDWRARHKKTIHHSYASCEYYPSYRDEILAIYDKKYLTISELSVAAVELISELIGIDREFINSKSLDTHGKKDDKLIEICQMVNADHYLTGPLAKDYIVKKKFDDVGITIEYKNYDGYPRYRQLWGEFSHFVSIIDLIFNCGEQAPYYIWGWRK